MLHKKKTIVSDAILINRASKPIQPDLAIIGNILQNSYCDCQHWILWPPRAPLAMILCRIFPRLVWSLSLRQLYWPMCLIPCCITTSSIQLDRIVNNHSEHQVRTVTNQDLLFYMTTSVVTSLIRPFVCV